METERQVYRIVQAAELFPGRNLPVPFDGPAQILFKRIGPDPGNLAWIRLVRRTDFSLCERILRCSIKIICRC